MKSVSENGHRSLHKFVLAFGIAALATCPIVSAVAKTAPSASTAVRVASYEPGHTYNGSHDPQRVYKVVQGLGMWKPSRKPERVLDVTCRAARRALEQEGVWTGWLGTDGSCRNADETLWATGNYLNFQAGPQETDPAP